MAQVPLAPPPPEYEPRWMWLLWKRISSAGQLLWSYIDFTGSNITDIATRNHADLQNINTASYTHLTSTQATDLTDAGDSTLHYHASDRSYADSAVSTHAAVTETHGATGAVVGTTNIQELSNKTFVNAGIVGTAGNGWFDFLAQPANPAPPSAGTARFHAATTQGFTRFEQDNEAATNLVLGRDNVFIVRNTSGLAMAKGVPVYVTGSTGNVPTVGLAKADSLTTIPAVGVLLDAVADNAFGQCMKLGVMSSFDTSAFSTGDNLYVSPTTAGQLTSTRPVTPNLVQRIASVLVDGIGNGSLLIVTAPFVGGMETGTTATTWKFNGFTLSMTADASVSGTNTGDDASQPVDATLTAIAALVDADGFLKNDGAGTFSYETPSAGNTAYSIMFAHSLG